jgi:hypothetical protein
LIGGVTVGFSGMDIIAIQLLARQLDGHSEQVDAFHRELSTAVSTTAWFGRDQAAFTERWNVEFAPALRRSGELLREAANMARRGVDGQQRASGAS